jgi:hypothetical protein
MVAALLPERRGFANQEFRDNQVVVGRRRFEFENRMNGFLSLKAETKKRIQRNSDGSISGNPFLSVGSAR